MRLEAILHQDLARKHAAHDHRAQIARGEEHSGRTGGER